MLDPKVRAMCSAANFAAITTLFPDGTPQTQMMWVGCDDEHVTFNTEVHRTKFTNLSHDPRVTIMVFDPAKPYSYVEVRGRVVDTVTGPEALDDINELAHKYMGQDYPNPITSERVIVKVAPERQHLHL